MRFSVLLVLLLCFFSLQAQFSQVGVIGSEPLGLIQLNSPAAATIGPDGYLYFINEGSDEILVYGTDGTFIRSIEESFKPSFVPITDIAINNLGVIYLLIHDGIFVLDYQGNFLQKLGSYGSGPDEFANPSGMDIDDDGNIWISDYFNNRIKKIDPSGNYISEFASPSPYGIDVTSNAVYVTDFTDIDESYVKKYTLNGEFTDGILIFGPPFSNPLVTAEDKFVIATAYGLHEYNMANNFIFPIQLPQNEPIVSMGLALQNDKLFITNWYNKVITYDLQSLSVEFFLVSDADGQFGFPVQMAMDENQNIYVADELNHRIQVFDPDGNFIRKFGSFGYDNGGIRFPQDITVDSNGDCYVLNNNGVSVFDEQGNFLRQFYVDGYGGIAVDQNYVYVAGPFHRGIQRFDKNGGSQELIIESDEPVKDFVIDEFGNFYLAEPAAGKVSIYNNSGVSLQIIDQLVMDDDEWSVPQGIARDDQGRIYVANFASSGKSRAQIFDPDGNLLATIELGKQKSSSGIVVNSNGRVYMTEIANLQVEFFDGDLDLLEVPEIEVIPPAMTYGDPDLQIEPTSPSTGAFYFKIQSGTAAEITNDGKLTVLGAGQVSIKVTQSPTALHTQGVTVVSLEISKAELLATADDKLKTYGDENPEFTVKYQGFKNDDTLLDIDTSPHVSTNATSASSPGEYPIELNDALDNNYEFSYASGLLTIEKAPLIVTAENKSRKYGDENPQLTAQYSGFVNSDEISQLDAPPTLSTIAQKISSVGEYSINVNNGSDNNYDIIHEPGILTISKAPLTAKAENKSRKYGDENPQLTAQYNGFVNNDGISDLDTPPILSSTAQKISSVGYYPINANNGSDNNYDFTYEPGVLTISKAPLTATAADKTKVYKTANPEFTIEYTGFKNNDDPSSLNTKPSSSTTATLSSSVGMYAITLSGGIATNYEFTLINGQLTITKANQVISFEPLPSPVFNTLPPFTLQATSDSELPVTYNVSSGPATVVGGVLTLSKELGTVTIEAKQPGNENYNSATPVARTFQVILDPVLGIDEDSGNIKIYPNPARDEFLIESQSVQILEVILIDAKGVQINLPGQSHDQEFLVNAREIPNGLYILRMKTSLGQYLTRKIAIVR